LSNFSYFYEIPRFLLLFFFYCLCCSFNEANYFSSTNIKRTFSLFLCWLYYLKHNIWCVCVCACMSRKLFHTHTYCDSNKGKKKRRKRLVLIYSSLKEEDDVIIHECGTRRLNANSWLFLFRHSKGNIIVVVVDLSLLQRNIN